MNAGERATSTDAGYSVKMGCAARYPVDGGDYDDPDEAGKCQAEH